MQTVPFNYLAQDWRLWEQNEVSHSIVAGVWEPEGCFGQGASVQFPTDLNQNKN